MNIVNFTASLLDVPTPDPSASIYYNRDLHYWVVTSFGTPDVLYDYNTVTDIVLPELNKIFNHKFENKGEIYFDSDGLVTDLWLNREGESRACLYVRYAIVAYGEDFNNLKLKIESNSKQVLTSWYSSRKSNLFTMSKGKPVSDIDDLHDMKELIDFSFGLGASLGKCKVAKKDNFLYFPNFKRTDLIVTLTPYRTFVEFTYKFKGSNWSVHS